MVRKNKDAKFVIYQVLYIFVITVLALKGADLDLGEVVNKDETVQKSVRDSLLTVIDSLNALGLDFSIKVDPNAAEENIKLKQQVASLSSNIKKLSKKIKKTPPKPKSKPKVKVERKLPSPFSKSKTFLQYAWNLAENKSTIPVQIFDPANMSNPIVIVPPKASKKFDLEDQTEVILRYGNQSERIKVVKNRPPNINIELATTKMNKADVYVKDLQRITVFRVTISDERIDQLRITYSGPISVSGPNKNAKGNLIYNVSLKLASSDEKFDEWLDRNENMQEADGRYKANFFFNAVDVKSKQSVNIGDSFYFTEYQK